MSRRAFLNGLHFEQLGVTNGKHGFRCSLGTSRTSGETMQSIIEILKAECFQTRYLDGNYLTCTRIFFLVSNPLSLRSIKSFPAGLKSFGFRISDFRQSESGFQQCQRKPLMRSMTCGIRGKRQENEKISRDEKLKWQGNISRGNRSRF